MAKTDFLGGIVIFAIMFGIALIELLLMRNFQAGQANVTEEESSIFQSLLRGPIACKEAGGSWNSTGDCCSNCPKCKAIILRC